MSIAHASLTANKQLYRQAHFQSSATIKTKTPDTPFKNKTVFGSLPNKYVNDLLWVYITRA